MNIERNDRKSMILNRDFKSFFQKCKDFKILFQKRILNQNPFLKINFKSKIIFCQLLSIKSKEFLRKPPYKTANLVKTGSICGLLQSTTPKKWILKKKE